MVATAACWLEGDLTDGVVVLRSPRLGDAERFVSERDVEVVRFLGAGSPNPKPTACIVVADDVVGWIDFDIDRNWLEPGEANVGYALFPAHRGRGYGTRALQILTDYLHAQEPRRCPTLLIGLRNLRSISVAERAGFELHSHIDDQMLFKHRATRPENSPPTVPPTE